jgi:hypothetical protein
VEGLDDAGKRQSQVVKLWQSISEGLVKAPAEGDLPGVSTAPAGLGLLCTVLRRSLRWAALLAVLRQQPC